MDQHELIERITDPDKWPGFENSEQLHQMDDMAEAAFSRNTADGYLAYVLIIHQICDDLIRMLIAHSHFTLELLTVSNGFGIRFPNENLDKYTSGQLLQALERSFLDFDQRDEFIKVCNEMNSIRNQMAHQLAKQPNLEQLKQTAEKYKTKVATVEELFSAADDNFRLFYKDEKKSDTWDIYLQEALNDASGGEERAEYERLIKIRKEAGYG